MADQKPTIPAPQPPADLYERCRLTTQEFSAAYNTGTLAVHDAVLRKAVPIAYAAGYAAAERRFAELLPSLMASAIGFHELAAGHFVTLDELEQLLVNQQARGEKP